MKEHFCKINSTDMVFIMTKRGKEKENGGTAQDTVSRQNIGMAMDGFPIDCMKVTNVKGCSR